VTWIVRVYSTQKKARDAAKKVSAEKGIPSDRVFVMAPVADADADAISAEVAAAVDGGNLPQTYGKIASDSLQQGLTVLAVDPPFGTGAPVTKILDGFEPVKVDRPDAAKEPRLASEQMGIPLLLKGRSIFGGELSSSPYSFLGSPKLSNDPAPLSSKAGMKLLSESDPTPLSSRFKMKVLSASKTDWKRSMGLPMLSSNPAPLSSLFRMKTLSEPKKEWTHSMGQPLLSSEPAPLSKLMGWSVLSK
jgi:hypothetical protein